MIKEILLAVTLAEFSFVMFFLIKHSIVFFKLVKDRDGYYLIRGVF